jgi:hypothetical protein
MQVYPAIIARWGTALPPLARPLRRVQLLRVAILRRARHLDYMTNGTENITLRDHSHVTGSLTRERRRIDGIGVSGGLLLMQQHATLAERKRRVSLKAAERMVHVLRVVYRMELGIC